VYAPGEPRQDRVDASWPLVARVEEREQLMPLADVVALRATPVEKPYNRVRVIVDVPDPSRGISILVGFALRPKSGEVSQMSLSTMPIEKSTWPPFDPVME
jgi:hypothetical protein